MDLQGRGAMVTGGSSDLGAVICATVARAGCDLALGYVANGEGADRSSRTVEGLGRRACVVQLDQADAGAIEPAINIGAARLGRILGEHVFPHLR